MTDNEFLLFDRLEKIKATVTDESKFYISYSGGKDSNVISALIDMALPGNTIPRVYCDTGIEYKMVREFVLHKAETDKRIVVLRPGVKIIQMLRENGYPFKSKNHARALYEWPRKTKLSIGYYQGESSPNFACPQMLKYQFEESGLSFKVSDNCCTNLKEKPFKKYQKKTGRAVAITGLMKSEGGRRVTAKCQVFSMGKLKRFNPLAPMTKEWEDWFIDTHHIKLPELYYPPYNFIRTGCKGCPFALFLQHELDVLERLLPAEKKQCEIIWAPVYAEYRRLGYRLRPVDENQTMIPGLEYMK